MLEKTSRSRSVNKKTIIYTSEALPAALAYQASKSSDLQSGGLIWILTSKQKQKSLQLYQERHVVVRAQQIGCQRLHHSNYF